MKVTIDRRIWLRGEGPNKTALRRPRDGKMCCVGIFMHAAGVPLTLLNDTTTAISFSRRIKALPGVCSWLTSLTTSNGSSTDADAAYNVNDIEMLSDDVRERELTAIFGRNEIELEFVN